MPAIDHAQVEPCFVAVDSAADAIGNMLLGGEATETTLDETSRKLAEALHATLSWSRRDADDEALLLALAAWL